MFIFVFVFVFVDRSVYIALRFYPMLDVDELYKILTTEKSLLLAHPQLANEEVDERMVRASLFSICSSLSLKKKHDPDVKPSP